MVSLMMETDPLETAQNEDLAYSNPATTEAPSPITADTPPHQISELDVNMAAMYVTDALHFRNLPFRRDKLALYRTYQDRITRYIFVVFPALLLGLALIEAPAVRVMEVHWQAVLALEVMCLVACACRVLHLRLCLSKTDFCKDVKNWVVIVSLVIMVIDMVVWVVIRVVQDREVIRISRVLRPLLIVNFSDNRNLRKLLRNIKRTVLDVISVLVLIFLFIAIFAMMATKFFERRTLLDPHGDRYLDNFGDSYWNLYVLMTTANSPDISLPAFQDEEGFFLFFMPFSIITTFVLMNILLAVVYKHYRMHLVAEVRNDVQIIQANLRQAFHLLKDPGTGLISNGVWRMSYHRLGCPDELQKLYWGYLVPEEGAAGISLKSFFKITDLLSSQIRVVITKNSWLESRFPGFYNSTISCLVRKTVEHIGFTIFYDVLIFCNAIALSLKDSPTQLEDVFLVLFNIEIILKIYTLGPRKFAGQAWNIYDCLVIWAASIASILVDAEGLHDTKEEELSAVFLDMVMTLRVMRLLKLLTSVPQLRLIVSTLMQIVPSMGSYAILLFLFYYSFAIVGMELFAGKLVNSSLPNCGNSAINGTDFEEAGYCILSFNNILYSFVVLWTLTLVNQWHILAGGFVAVSSEWARLYFLSFHVCVVLIILNIFLAFVIEAFMLQIEMDKNKQEGIDHHLDSRGMNARRDSSPHMTESVWYRRPAQQQDEENKIFIGTTPLDEKIKYKREHSTKSYNQLLLEMFQEDIQTDRHTDIQTGEVPESEDPAVRRRLTSVQEEGQEGQEEEEKGEGCDKISYGSLEDLGII